jgi:2-C-methyl-D-erythritol 2,4-cyclodiphosphate synthase
MLTRVGIGFDAHPLVKGRALILGGVEIPHSAGLDGHSDADALSHAIADALLGAAGMGDLGALFPSTDPRLKGCSSLDLLRQVAGQVAAAGWLIGNVDAVIIAQEPRLAPHVDGMRAALAECLGTEAGAVSIKATTTDRLGTIGRGEGIAAQAVVLVRRAGDASPGHR